MVSFPQSDARVVAAESPSWVWHWCYGCQRKAAVHKTHQTALHLDFLEAGESLSVPKGKQHYDGTWDRCDVEGRP